MTKFDDTIASQGSFGSMTTNYDPVSSVDSPFASPGTWDKSGTKRKVSMPKIAFLNKKLLRRSAVIVGLLVLVSAVIWITNIRIPVRSNVAGVATTANDTKNIAKLNQTYTFNARTDQGKIIDKKLMQMTITSVELSKSILIKGQPATARDGKAFLILNIELENSATDRVYLPINDLIRWQESGKLRAPDVHNNLVLVDPISTKPTRVGFLVDESAKNFSIQVGEVNSAKQTIDLKL